jgi:adenine-specific DNA-methyltransferase
MLSFKEFIEEEDLVSKLKYHYLRYPLENSKKKQLDDLIQKTLRLDESDFGNQEFDNFSSLYEKEILFKDRRKSGEIYTPLNIVRYILKEIGYNERRYIREKTIIDISCGVGSFLIESVKILKRVLLKNHINKDIKILEADELIQVFNIIKIRVYGADLNPIACILCQLNLFYTLMDIIRVIKVKKPQYQFGLFNIINTNSIKMEFDQKYDFIVGNPPYLFIRDIPLFQKKLIEAQNLETNSGQYDLYQIFIELGIKLLKNNGFLGFIIPDSILALSNRRNVRKFILEKTIIKKISIVGSQFDEPVVANIILILQKEVLKTNRIENQVKVSNFSSGTISKLPQVLFVNLNYRFLVNLDDIDIQILENLSQTSKLRDLIRDQRFDILLSRGVELGKEGKIIFCKKCKTYSPLPKKSLRCKSCKAVLLEEKIERIIQKKPPRPNIDDYRRLLYSINRYKSLEYRYISIKKPGIKYKPEEIYKDRIVIRQLNQDNLICATYDNFAYTTQSFYNLKVKTSKIPEFTNFYLLGLLNSSLLSYFFIKSFGSYKKLFPRILIEKIESLPIKIPLNENDKELAIQIHQNVANLIKKNTADPSIIGEIDHLVYKLYQIDSNLIAHIKSSLNLV